MPHLDRLSSLISQFQVTCDRLDGPEGSNIALLQDGDRELLTLDLRACPEDGADLGEQLMVRIDVGGEDNPLFQSLPCRITVDLADAPEVAAIVGLLKTESAAPRCGGGVVLDRLCELLVVNLLRHQIERQGAEPGVFAGLAHPNLSRVLVAMHDSPGKRWVVDDLVVIAGMSRSHFMAEFQSVVGKTPMAYLRNWRMTLARGALTRGARVNETARKYGYGSGDAFCRAFTSTYGFPPTQLAASPAG